MALFAAGFSGAVLFNMMGLPYGTVLSGSLLAVAVVLFLLRCPWSIRLGLVALGASIGLVWSWSYVQREVRWTDDYDGRVRTLSMEAAAYSRTTAYGTATTVSGVVDGHSFTAVLYGEYDLSLKPGDMVHGLVKLQSTDTYWGEEDLFYGTRGVDFTMRLYDRHQVQKADSIPVRYWPLYFSHILQEQLGKLLPEVEKGYAVALLSGDRGGLSELFQTQLSQSGTNHIVAVSGMHIGILMGAIMLLLGQYGWKSSVVGLPLIWIFALSVGMTASVVRSAIMFSLLLIAYLAHRDNDIPTTILLALLLIILPNPRAILDVGLQLSFTSVTGILLFSSRIFQRFWTSQPIQWLVSQHRIFRKLIRPVCAGVASSIAVIPLTMPLSLLYFDSFSLVTPLSGAVIVPLIPACFLLSMIAALISLLSMPMAIVLSYPLQWLIGMTMGLTRWVAGLPFAWMTMDNGYALIFLVLFYGIVLVLLLDFAQSIRLWIPVAAIGCSFLGCLLLSSLEYDRAQLSVTMLNVGQGQCIYVESKGISAMYDCGGEDRPAARAVSFLHSAGRFRLHVLLVSHYDSDHAGGVPELLRSVRVDTIYLPATADDGDMQAQIVAAAEETGTQVYFVKQDLTMTFGASVLSVYAPVFAIDGNNGSLSAHWRYDQFDVLMTGDMDTTAERILLNRQSLSAIEVLVAGHHGAATSTGDTLLEQLTPELVLISVGAENSYGHPAAETLERLRQSGASVYRTDQCGNITIRR
ncbi:DNA internalization-related competence protein ComEC/Rec2 [Candidatus Avoscillospira sp. LCP25S3_F1]|uniref:DNA internalization-related competence protein ComEC/Rec2 n=1 Tax=Candidatus Avoscillospira sp. LCP25S3_F1 TaxID=3438825 RepID=UPI003F920F18